MRKNQFALKMFEWFEYEHKVVDIELQIWIMK